MKTINNEDIISIVELHQERKGFEIKNLLLKGSPNKELNKKLEEMEVPVVVQNTGVIVQEGYMGDSLSDILVELLKESNGDLEKAQKGVVMLDNFEKWRTDDRYLTEKKNLTRSYEKRMKDYYFKKDKNFHHQRSLIPYLKGEVIPIMIGKNKVLFDTSELTIVMIDNHKEEITNENEMVEGYIDTSILKFVNLFCEYSDRKEKPKEFIKYR